MTPLIENASRRDLPQILAIYNEVIRNSTAVYTEERIRRGPRRRPGSMPSRAAGYPVRGRARASGIAGFGTFGEFRAWPCYRHSVEHSVHVRADRRGQGIGRALVLRTDGARRGRLTSMS